MEESLVRSDKGLFKALGGLPGLAGAALTVALLQPGDALAQNMFGRGGPGSWWGGMGLSLFGGPLMILFWVVVIIALVMLIRWLVRGENYTRPDRRSEALEIIKARYASGEIDRQEFLRLKQDLTAG